MAAAALQINEIRASSALRYPVDVPGIGVDVNPQIWSLAGGVALTPIALWLEISPNVFQISITFQNNGTAPWAGAPATARCVIEGRGPNGTVIRTAARNIPANGAVTIVNGFSFTAPNLNFAFADSGLWQWSIIYVPPAGAEGPVVTSANTTSLELYLYRGSHDTALFSQLPSELLRMMFPTYNQLYGAGIVNSRQALYSQIVNRIWAHGLSVPPANTLQYDVNFGAGGGVSYRSGPSNDVFELSDWIAKNRPWCNCGDLAAFVYVTCRVYGRLGAAGPWVVPARVRYIDPFGHIVPGSLFGWPAHANCNNPFWRNNPTNANPNTGSNDAGRTAFSTHKCVALPTAVTGGAGDCIMDACHAIGAAPNGFPQGTDTELNYHIASVNDGPIYAVPPIPPSYSLKPAGPNLPIRYEDEYNPIIAIA